MSREPEIQTLSEHLCFQNAYIRVYDNDVEFPNGEQGTYLRIVNQAPGRGAVIVAERGGEFALVRTFRYPIGAWEWSFPRGFAHGSNSGVTARTELYEEVGIDSERVMLLGTITPDSGLLGTHVDIYHAPVGDPSVMGARDKREIHDVRWVDATRLRELIAAGEIRDGFTLSALMLMTVRGLV